MTDDVDRPRPLARHDDQPAFAEPWQAEVLVMAEALVEAGVIEAADWAGALGEALRQEPDRGDPREHYYRAVLGALERLMAKRGEVTVDGLRERVEAWRRAYLSTPHGEPVELRGERSAQGRFRPASDGGIVGPEDGSCPDG